MANRSCSERFIESAILKHGGYYDYSKVDYVNAKTKVVIICREHGPFSITPNGHLNGRGCYKCGVERVNKCKTSSKEEFVEKSVLIHGDKYDYSKVIYKTARIKVEIICNEHGAFEQVPYSHLIGNGCNKCGNKKIGESLADSKEDFIRKAIFVHGRKYDYSGVFYKNARVKVSIRCREHGVFYQKPYNHLIGNGCPFCSKSGFNYSEEAYLYYLSINDGEGFKIGVTNRSIEERYKGEFEKIKVLMLLPFKKGYSAYKAEQEVLKKYADSIFQGCDLLSSGNTEVFNKDVLRLDA